MSATGLETVLKRDGYLVVAALVALTALAWAYLAWLSGHMPIRGDDMAGMDIVGMAPMTAAPSSAMAYVFAFLMWTVMMVGMMTPSVAPMILLYAWVGRQAALNGKAIAATGWFAAGYFLAWAGFSAAAAATQLAARNAALLTPQLSSANLFMAGDLLILAGFYQWSRLKAACLVDCRAPLLFLQRHGGFKANPASAVALGFRHGLSCIGCCWVLMLLLFVGGVMNLLWIAGLSILILLEKLVTKGPDFARAAGGVMIASGIFLVWQALS